MLENLTPASPRLHMRIKLISLYTVNEHSELPGLRNDGVPAAGDERVGGVARGLLSWHYACMTVLM